MQLYANTDATIAAVEDGVLALLVRRGGTIRRLVQTEADENGFHLLASTKGARRDLPQFTVLRSPGTALSKRLSLPFAARARIEGLLGYEIDRETPFGRDEVYWNYVVRAQDRAEGKLEVEFVVMPKLAVQPFVEALERAGLHPDAIETQLADGQWLQLRTGTQAGTGVMRSRSLTALAAAACILLIVAAALPFLRQQQAIGAAEATIAALTPEAEEAASLRKANDTAASGVDVIEKQRNHMGSALAALADMTRILPDNAYATAMSLHDGALTITGLAPSAADLVGRLAKAPGFANPAFAAPVLRNGDNKLETFTITVALVPAGAS